MATYKIKDVEQLTGIKAHTIRIWEKRYGILSPSRTSTKIRSYSDPELVQLINIALLNKHGIKISKIADLSQDQIADELLKIKTNPEINDSLEKLILSLIGMNETLFAGTVQELIDRIGLEDTFVLHLVPFLERVGIMWLVGSINPAQEHFMSNLIRQKLISSTDQLPFVESNEPPILLYVPEHELHEISLLFYNFLLKKSGRNTVYLGQSLPYDAVLKAVEMLKPGCILTCWLTSVDSNFMVNYFKKLWEETQVNIYVGGYQMKVHGDKIVNWSLQVTDAESIRAIQCSKAILYAKNHA